MPSTNYLIAGALGLFLLSRMRNGNGAAQNNSNDLGSFFQSGGYQNIKTNSTEQLITADNTSSGQGTFGNNQAQGQSAPVLTPQTTYQLFSGDTYVEGLVVDPTTVIPKQGESLAPPEQSIGGPLSAFFNVTGPTVSEISGAAVRQVGILSPYESGIISESNNPQIAFINVNMNGASGPLIDDEPIEVVAPASGVPKVLTIAGSDGSTVVTTGANRSTDSYFSTAGTILESINQGYFDAPKPYEAQTVYEIEQAWAESPEGIASREAKQNEIADAYAFVASLGNGNNSNGFDFYSTWEE
jgi:hypothetical protein